MHACGTICMPTVMFYCKPLISSSCLLFRLLKDKSWTVAVKTSLLFSHRLQSGVAKDLALFIYIYI